MTRRALLFLSLALLAGCASAPSGPPQVIAAPGASLPELEPVYAVAAGRDALTLIVASNGCTRKEDFAFHVERRDGVERLSFGRRRLDTCKSFAPGKVDIRFTWEELGLAGGAPVFLLNPLARWGGPGPL
jgi:hypothetical protein